MSRTRAVLTAMVMVLACLALTHSVNRAEAASSVATTNIGLIAKVERLGTRDPSGARGFQYVSGVAIGPGSFFVADTGNHRLAQIDSQGKILTSWGRYGPDPNNLNAAAGFYEFPKDAEAASSSVYVADTMNHRILRYSMGGTLLASFGGLGLAEGKLNCPYGFGTAKDGTVVVADTMAHRIVRFDADGKFLNMFGNFGKEPGQFQFPHDAASDSNGYIYVSDYANNRIQKFTPAGELVALWGEEGKEDGQMSYPWGIAVDANDNVWVSDSQNHRVQAFRSNGDHIMSLAIPDLERPKGLALSREGVIYVADSGNSNIAKITLTSGALAALETVAR